MTTREFLLEIGTEEIPASFVKTALSSASDLLQNLLKASWIGHGEVRTFATPRRLVLAVADVEPLQAAREIEKTGPPVSAAYDEKGNFTKAAVGFARSQGVDVSELVVVKTARGEQVAVRKVEEGRPTVEVLAEALPGLMERIVFPKTMRWMDLDARFARPIHWIVAVLGGQIVPFNFGNIQSGNMSRGHRFVHPESFPVTCLEDLRSGLDQRGVILDQEARKRIIREKAGQLAASEGVHVLDDAELLEEVTYLVESPHPIIGKFPPEFLELPASILVTCMKKHQRYFSVQDSEGRIRNWFVAVNNTPVKDANVSIRGHQRVLKARLEDARFYYLEDRKEPLVSRLEALKGVVFHSKLGTAYEKVERFTILARKMAEMLAPDRVHEVERASMLCKCDLETGIVYEFPELQGIIGSYYARMDGEPDAVATAIREHYLPAYAGDDLPEGIVGALVSIADRIDTIVGCFSVGLIPTGAADPYALRRNALGIIQILINLGHPLDLAWLIREAGALLAAKRTRPEEDVFSDVMDFIKTRFINFHTSRGFPLDVVEAVVRARCDDPVDARRRVEALHEWKQRDDFDSIVIGFKRVVNILRGMPETGPPSPELFASDGESKLFSAYKTVSERALPLIKRGEYAKALEEIADLKSPIDNFFDDVMVMVDVEDLRTNRLALLREIAKLFGNVADFSFIGSTAENK